MTFYIRAWVKPSGQVKRTAKSGEVYIKCSQDKPQPYLEAKYVESNGKAKFNLWGRTITIDAYYEGKEKIVNRHIHLTIERPADWETYDLPYFYGEGEEPKEKEEAGEQEFNLTIELRDIETTDYAVGYAEVRNTETNEIVWQGEVVARRTITLPFGEYSIRAYSPYHSAQTIQTKIYRDKVLAFWLRRGTPPRCYWTIFLTEEGEEWSIPPEKRALAEKLTKAQITFLGSGEKHKPTLHVFGHPERPQGYSVRWEGYGPYDETYTYRGQTRFRAWIRVEHPDYWPWVGQATSPGGFIIHLTPKNKPLRKLFIVKDQDGNPLSNVAVIVRSGDRDYTFLTDRNGEVRGTIRELGNYVLVFAEGPAPLYSFATEILTANQFIEKEPFIITIPRREIEWPRPVEQHLSPIGQALKNAGVPFLPEFLDAYVEFMKGVSHELAKIFAEPFFIIIFHKDLDLNDREPDAFTYFDAALSLLPVLYEAKSIKFTGIASETVDDVFRLFGSKLDDFLDFLKGFCPFIKKGRDTISKIDALSTPQFYVAKSPAHIVEKIKEIELEFAKQRIRQKWVPSLSPQMFDELADVASKRPREKLSWWRRIRPRIGARDKFWLIAGGWLMLDTVPFFVWMLRKAGILEPTIGEQWDKAYWEMRDAYWLLKQNPDSEAAREIYRKAYWQMHDVLMRAREVKEGVVTDVDKAVDIFKAIYGLSPGAISDEFEEHMTIMLDTYNEFYYELTGEWIVEKPPEEVVRLEKGTIRISTSPSGARISIDGRATYLYTPEEIEDVEPGTHTIYLDKPGFWGWTKQIEVKPGEKVELWFPLVPLFAPRPEDVSKVSKVKIRSRPSHLRIYVNGTPTPYLTPQTLRLPFGRYRIGFVWDPYGLIEYEVEINNVEQELYFDLRERVRG